MGGILQAMPFNTFCLHRYRDDTNISTSVVSVGCENTINVHSGLTSMMYTLSKAPKQIQISGIFEPITIIRVQFVHLAQLNSNIIIPLKEDVHRFLMSRLLLSLLFGNHL